ncbi:hypothetical protein pb186bvf_001362 [Paramecium bursaria]
MDFDEDFFRIQQDIRSINKDLVIINQNVFENSTALIQQLLLQIKIYGSKIIELYQSLDEICPTDRNTPKQLTFTKIVNQIDYEQVWNALKMGFKYDVYKAMDLMQQIDYTVPYQKINKDQMCEYLQITNKYKDQEVEKLCSLFQDQYPQSYFSQIQHITQILQQYSQMIPILVQENEDLRNILEKSAFNHEIKFNTEKDVSLSSDEIQKLKYKLCNIERQMNDTTQLNDTAKLQRSEEQLRCSKNLIQQLQIELEDIKFKYGTSQEEIKNLQEQIISVNQSHELIQAEFKKQISKKNQRIQELEDQSKQVTSEDLDNIQNKLQQFKNLYEQKVKTLQAQIFYSEQENLKLKDVIRTSAGEVDNLRLQIEQVMNQQLKKSGQKSAQKRNNTSEESFKINGNFLLQKYQEIVEKNEQTTNHVYSTVLDGSLLQ